MGKSLSIDFLCWKCNQWLLDKKEICYWFETFFDIETATDKNLFESKQHKKKKRNMWKRKRLTWLCICDEYACGDDVYKVCKYCFQPQKNGNCYENQKFGFVQNINCNLTYFFFYFLDIVRKIPLKKIIWFFHFWNEKFFSKGLIKIVLLKSRKKHLC